MSTRSARTSSNFNPRSSCEERPGYAFAAFLMRIFQSTLLMRGATSLSYLLMSAVARFQSTLLMRGATIATRADCRSRDFNPRSSCEERLSASRGQSHMGQYFNPRSSCEERRQISAGAASSRISIHAPHARSDCGRECRRYGQADFNPRSSCEERQFRQHCRLRGRYFNPRSSCEERRADHSKSITVSVVFQSTLLMRGAT